MKRDEERQRHYKLLKQHAWALRKGFCEGDPMLEKEMEAEKNLKHCTFWDFLRGSGFKDSVSALISEAEKAIAAMDQGEDRLLKQFGCDYACMLDNAESARKILRSNFYSKDCKLFILMILHENLIGLFDLGLIIPDHRCCSYAGIGAWRDEKAICETSCRFRDLLMAGSYPKCNQNGDPFYRSDASLYEAFMQLDPALSIFREWTDTLDLTALEDMCFRLTGCAMWDPELFDRMTAIIEEREKGIFARLKDSNDNGILWRVMPSCDLTCDEHPWEAFWDVYESKESRKTRCLAVVDILLKLGCDPLACGSYGLNWNDIFSIASFETTYFSLDPRFYSKPGEREKKMASTAYRLSVLAEYYKWREERIAMGYTFPPYRGEKMAQGPISATMEKLLTP